MRGGQLPEQDGMLQPENSDFHDTRESLQELQFCNVEESRPVGDDGQTCGRSKGTGLLHSVITSVTRDDLPDGGAGHFARTIRAIRDKCPGTIVEVLIPDFKGDKAALNPVVKAAPDIINHNVETVPRLYRGVRPQACYERSLQVLQNVKSMNDKISTKSGIMVGLGESRDEVIEVFKDLLDAGCDFLTVGQYLAPSEKHYSQGTFIRTCSRLQANSPGCDLYAASSPCKKLL